MSGPCYCCCACFWCSETEPTTHNIGSCAHSLAGLVHAQNKEICLQSETCISWLNKSMASGFPRGDVLHKSGVGSCKGASLPQLTAVDQRPEKLIRSLLVLVNPFVPLLDLPVPTVAWPLPRGGQRPAWVGVDYSLVNTTAPSTFQVRSIQQKTSKVKRQSPPNSSLCTTVANDSGCCCCCCNTHSDGRARPTPRTDPLVLPPDP